MRMPFGKHKGWLISDLPLDYLIWCEQNLSGIGPRLRAAIEDELSERLGPRRRRRRWQEEEAEAERRRQQREREREAEARARSSSPPPAKFETVITRWHHEMVMQFHPDRGGSNEIMQALNHSADRLRQLVHEMT
jgi:hypothetical protein